MTTAADLAPGAPLAAAVAAAAPAGAPIAVVRDGSTWVVALLDAVQAVDGDASFDAVERMWRTGGRWIGAAAYDLGAAVEHVERRAVRDRQVPDLAFARTGAELHLGADGTATSQGGSRGERRTLTEALRRARTSRATAPQPPMLGVMRSSLGRDEHARGVAEIHRLLRAGDCYQVNLTRRLTSPMRIEGRAAFHTLSIANPAPHAMLAELDATTVVGASPECFLSLDGRRVTTSPIKGSDADRDALLASVKDRAEHVMIVDLARNDLGRVAAVGSVRATRSPRVESHPGIHHLVTDVHARLRDECTFGALLRATMPAASITGAPKPRVMQAIEDLEPVRRGIYCGATGWFDGARERAELAVAIRTFVVTEAGTDLGVGGGIVMDSDAGAEWRETELKAARLLRALGAYERAEPLVGAHP